ncbi:MAG TPA: isoprenylcysteine carboxylmethyltransferase family protein [Allosphingosinicella sp.]|nr:isoprenylcysteine carboxylmethyltransferase family protein [Allosphingosinicella sp.]
MNAELKIDPVVRSDPRPRSAVSTGVGMAGLAGFVAWAAVSRVYGLAGPLASLVTLLACGVPMVLWSLLVDKVHRNPSTGIDWDSPPRPLRESFDISLAKIVGLWGIWAAIAFLYCVGRWYWDGQYLFAMEVLAVGSVPMLLLSVPYVLWLDRRLSEPRDGAWHFGRLIIGRTQGLDREMLYDFFRAWAVKGFFLAFMISIVPGNWFDLIRPAAWEITAGPVSLARWLIAAMFTIDVSFATVGYMLTMKPLDAHIRSANPYAAGWTAALICYPPFILMNPGGPLAYHQGTAEWVYWLDGSPLATALTGAVLVLLAAVYAWATVAFGIRFSNLTHRGILTHGPYAWTKHPAYVSKSLFWWIATLPFLAASGNPVDMVRNTVLLGIVTGVYYWRARTEERHLSADPAYRDYAAWMERNAPLPRLLARLVRRPSPQPLPAE